MKTTKFPLLMAAALLSILSITSCTKKQGCTVATATNYDASADEDNGTCNFEGSVIFWSDADASINMLTDDILIIHCYIDGVHEGEYGADAFFDSEPSCESGGALKITKSLGNAMSKSFSLELRDQDDYEIVAGALTLNDDGCYKFKVEY